MRLLAKTCVNHQLTTRVEDLLAVHHGTLCALLAGKQDPTTLRANAQGLHAAPYLIVQLLYEEAEQLPRKQAWRAAQMKALAQHITQLHNETLLIPTRRSQLDGPTDLIRPKSKRKPSLPQNSTQTP